MTPAPPAPYGVIVNVYLPLLTLSLGYVQVQGMWLEIGRPQPQAWKATAPPWAAWQKLMAPSPRTWKTERP
jgi:hypothetical protein